MAQWSGGPGFKLSNLLLTGFVLSCPEFNCMTLAAPCK